MNVKRQPQSKGKVITPQSKGYLVRKRQIFNKKTVKEYEETYFKINTISQ